MYIIQLSCSKRGRLVPNVNNSVFVLPFLLFFVVVVVVVFENAINNVHNQLSCSKRGRLVPNVNK